MKSRLTLSHAVGILVVTTALVAAAVTVLGGPLGGSGSAADGGVEEFTETAQLGDASLGTQQPTTPAGDVDLDGSLPAADRRDDASDDPGAHDDAPESRDPGAAGDDDARTGGSSGNAERSGSRAATSGSARSSARAATGGTTSGRKRSGGSDGAPAVTKRSGGSGGSASGSGGSGSGGSGSSGSSGSESPAPAKTASEPPPSTAPSQPARATASAACAVDFRVRDTWNSGYTADVTITNTGASQVSGWTLTWRFSDGETIDGAWNMRWSQQGTSVQAGDLGHNATIAPGGSVTIGFNARHDGSRVDPPTSFTLNGSACG